MSNVSIVMTGADSACVTFSSRQKGDCLTVGIETQHTVNISDGHFLRRMSGEFFRLRNANISGTIALKLGDAPRMKLDDTLWHDLADALIAFTMNIDLTKQLADLVAA